MYQNLFKQIRLILKNKDGQAHSPFYWFMNNLILRKKKEDINMCNQYRHSQNNFTSPMCKFSKDLHAGDDVDTLIIGGQSQNVDAFVSFDKKTGIATFVRNNGAVFVVGCD